MFHPDGGMRGADPSSGMIRRRLGPRKGEKRLSETAIEQNRQAAERIMAQHLAEARVNIHSQDPSLRLEAASHLDAGNADDFALLKNAVMTDPSAEVREEAAVQLVDGDPKVAVPALIDALADTDSEVAIAGIDSLSAIETADRTAIIAAIKELGSSHSQEEVRDAAEAALETLQ